VVVVGGGNSAGQAAVFLAGHARKVYLLVRGDNLDRLATAADRASAVGEGAEM